MKLYFYDHCPFSARVRMALAIKQIDAEQQVLPADDEQTITQLIGRHQIPVLVRQDDTPMADSLGIAKYLDYLDGNPIIAEPHSAALDDWLQPFVPDLQYLGYPRWTRIGLPEFASESALEHFREKKQHTIGDFEQALQNTPEKARAMERRLQKLPEMLDLTPRQRITWNDVVLFPMLRSLSVVEAIEWPQPVRRYTEAMAQRSGLDLFFDRAI